MDELAELERQFMELQEVKSNPLSDRTLVELLLKLPQFGLAFYQTSDGNEYITRQHLDEEIHQIVIERGRVAANDLSSIIGLNQDVIDSRLSIVNNKHGLLRIEDQLMSQEYLNSVVQMIKEKLQTRGKLTIQEVSTMFGFPIVYARKFILQRTKDIGADLSNDQLVTKQFDRLKRSKLAGCLNGTLKPILLSTLIKNFNLDERNTTQQIQQLVRQGRIKGRIIHGSYVPQQFESNQKNLIQDYMSSNKYIEYSMLQRNFFIARPKQWIKQNLVTKDIIMMEQVAITKKQIENVKETLVGILSTEGFVELSKLLPSALDDSDIETLFTEQLNLPDVVLSQGYAFSPDWLDKCVEEFRNRIIYSIFFKKDSGKDSKKKTKPKFSQQQVCQILLDNNLIPYDDLQDLKNLLYDLLTERIGKLYENVAKEVTGKSASIGNMLKYKKCKTIFSSLQKCSKFLTSLEKQFKKAEARWVDPDFGPQEDDPAGTFSIVYYDGILPKEWQSDGKIQWKSNTETLESIHEVAQLGPIGKSKYLSKCKLCDLLSLIDAYNAEKKDNKLNLNRFICEQFQQFQKYGVAVFRFYMSDGQIRYVLVDRQLPYGKGGRFYSAGQGSAWLPFIEKAYAKFRYCYKGILNVGFVQLAQQLTGFKVVRKSVADWISRDAGRAKQLEQEILSYLETVCKSQLVAVGTEGESYTPIEYDGEASGFTGNNVYLVYGTNAVKGQKRIRLKADGQISRKMILEDAESQIIDQQAMGYVFLSAEQFLELFKYIYVIFNGCSMELEKSKN